MKRTSPFYSEQMRRATHYANNLLKQDDMQVWQAALRGSKLFGVKYTDLQNALTMQVDVDLRQELRWQLWRMYRNLELDYT